MYKQLLNPVSPSLKYLRIGGGPHINICCPPSQGDTIIVGITSGGEFDIRVDNMNNGIVQGEILSYEPKKQPWWPKEHPDWPNGEKVELHWCSEYGICRR